MPDPQSATIQEAINHIKTWIASGEKEKAKQGLHELLEFDPNNVEAKKMMEDLEKPAAVNPAPVAPAAPTALTPIKLEPVKEPPKIVTPSPAPIPAPAPVPIQAAKEMMPISTPIIPPKTQSTLQPTAPKPPAQTPLPPKPAPATTPTTQAPTMTTPIDSGKERNKKIITLIISVAILLAGGYFLMRFFFGESKSKASQEITPESTASQAEITPQPTSEPTPITETITPEKVKRRD